MYKQKICLVYCYFGNLPWYFRYFLHSCKYNADVDFMLFTDAEVQNELPSNFKVFKVNINSIKRLIDQKLNIRTTFTNAYKLCDFKPAYGAIFSDYLVDYDFWGHGDIDLIFGNIRSFFTDNVLAEHDVICVRKEYVTGFLTLYRNTVKITGLYKASKDYRRIFEDAEHYCFDECGRTFFELMSGKSIFETDCAIESMTHVVQKLANSGEIKVHFEMCCIEDLPGKIEWLKGRLYFTKSWDPESTKIDWNNGSLHNERKEAILYHLIKFKKIRFSHVPQWKLIPENVYINKRSFSAFHYRSVVGRLQNYMMTLYSFAAVEWDFLKKWINARMYSTNKAYKDGVFIYHLDDGENGEYLKVDVSAKGIFCQMGDDEDTRRKSQCYEMGEGKYISLYYKTELEFSGINELICRESSQISPAWEQHFILNSTPTLCPPTSQVLHELKNIK